jgi:hypothetical protein
MEARGCIRGREGGRQGDRGRGRGRDGKRFRAEEGNDYCVVKWLYVKYRQVPQHSVSGMCLCISAQKNAVNVVMTQPGIEPGQPPSDGMMWLYHPQGAVHLHALIDRHTKGSHNAENCQLCFNDTPGLLCDN